MKILDVLQENHQKISDRVKDVFLISPYSIAVSIHPIKDILKLKSDLVKGNF